MNVYFFETKKCAKCGKKFYPAPQHVFKENSKWYCTWTCYNHRKDKKKKEKKNEKERPEQHEGSCTVNS